MSKRAQRITREVGTALAVLAIYVLTLLLPLHQAAALQRDLGALGFDTIGVWSICQQPGEASDSQVPTAVKCPALGIAKHQLAVVVPSAIQLEPPLYFHTIGKPTEAVEHGCIQSGIPGQPRARPRQS